MSINLIGKIHIARQVMAVRANDNLDIEYIKYVIQNNVKDLQENSKSLIPGISRKDVLEIKTPLPPLEEQKEIVKKIESLMQKYDQLEEETKTSEANAEMLMQSVLQEAFNNQ
jgi:type I restriction enzyme, S subunit